MSKVLFHIFSYIINKISKRPIARDFLAFMGHKLTAAPITNDIVNKSLTFYIQQCAWKNSLEGVGQQKTTPGATPGGKSSKTPGAKQASTPGATPGVASEQSHGIFPAVINMIDNWRMNDYSKELFGKLKLVFDMFTKTNSMDSFRNFYLDRAKAYYQNLAKTKISQLGVRDHIHVVHRCNERECFLSSLVMPESKPMKILIMTELVGPYIERFCDEFPQLLSGRDYDTGRELYDLSRDYDNIIKSQKRKPGQAVKEKQSSFVEMLVPRWKEFLDEDMRRYISANAGQFLESADKFVKMFSSYISEKILLVGNTFDNDINFQNSCDDVFEKYCNLISSKETGLSVSNICKLCMHYLNTLIDTRKPVDDGEFKKGLESLSIIIKYITSFDILFKCYKEDLTKRIICGLSISQRENAFLDSINDRCDGQNDVSPVIKMVKDLHESEEASRRYIDRRKGLLESSERGVRGDIGVKSTFMFFTPSAWPAHSNLVFSGVPPELNDLSDQFTKFYKETYSGNGFELQPFRRYWSVSVRFVQGDVKRTLSLTLLQFLILRWIYKQPKFTGPVLDLASFIFPDDPNQKKYVPLIMQECRSLKYLKLVASKQSPTGILIQGNPHFAPKVAAVECRPDLVVIPSSAMSEEEKREKEEQEAREQEEIKNSRLITTCVHAVRILKSRVDVGGIDKGELFVETGKSVSKWFTLQKDIFREALTFGINGKPSLGIERFAKYSDDDPDIIMLDMN